MHDVCLQHGPSPTITPVKNEVKENISVAVDEKPKV